MSFFRYPDLLLYMHAHTLYTCCVGVFVVYRSHHDICSVPNEFHKHRHINSKYIYKVVLKSVNSHFIIERYFLVLNLS